MSDGIEELLVEDLRLHGDEIVFRTANGEHYRGAEMIERLRDAHPDGVAYARAIRYAAMRLLGMEAQDPAATIGVDDLEILRKSVFPSRVCEAHHSPQTKHLPHDERTQSLAFCDQCAPADAEDTGDAEAIRVLQRLLAEAKGTR